MSTQARSLGEAQRGLKTKSHFWGKNFFVLPPLRTPMALDDAAMIPLMFTIRPLDTERRGFKVE